MKGKSRQTAEQTQELSTVPTVLVEKVKPGGCDSVVCQEDTGR